VKRLLIVLALGAALPAWAQQEERAADDAAERSAVEDIQPAVNFSRGTPNASTSAPSAPSAQAAPGSPPRARRGVVDTLDLGTTSITGSRELPRVLYIVPWKQSDLGDLVGRPVDTLLDEVLAPVDPEVFERHVTYYETLYGETEED
jgi:hypothetical protein